MIDGENRFEPAETPRGRSLAARYSRMNRALKQDGADGKEYVAQYAGHAATELTHDGTSGHQNKELSSLQHYANLRNYAQMKWINTSIASARLREVFRSAYA